MIDDSYIGYREKTEIPPLEMCGTPKCVHDVPYDSECDRCKSPLTHPLKNKASKHYELWNDLEVIELIEKVLTTEELIGACKFNILKYRLRIGNKDDEIKELQKVKDYENYLKFLEGKQCGKINNMVLR